MNLLVVITMMINYCQQGQRLEWFWFGSVFPIISSHRNFLFHFTDFSMLKLRHSRQNGSIWVVCSQQSSEPGGPRSRAICGFNREENSKQAGEMWEILFQHEDKVISMYLCI